MQEKKPLNEQECEAIFAKFASDIIDGSGGFKNYEQYEGVAIVDWVINCLSNPILRQTDEVLHAISCQRVRAIGEINAQHNLDEIRNLNENKPCQ